MKLSAFQDLRTFDIDKPPDYSTLVPKHVGVGT